MCIRNGTVGGGILPSRCNDTNFLFRAKNRQKLAETKIKKQLKQTNSFKSLTDTI